MGLEPKKSYSIGRETWILRGKNKQKFLVQYHPCMVYLPTWKPIKNQPNVGVNLPRGWINCFFQAQGDESNVERPQLSTLPGTDIAKKPQYGKKAGSGGFNVLFVFNPIPGEMIHFDEHMFQLGWDHQLYRLSPFFLGIQKWSNLEFLPSKSVIHPEFNGYCGTYLRKKTPKNPLWKPSQTHLFTGTFRGMTTLPCGNSCHLPCGFITKHATWRIVSFWFNFGNQEISPLYLMRKGDPTLFTSKFAREGFFFNLPGMLWLYLGIFGLRIPRFNCLCLPAIPSIPVALFVFGFLGSPIGGLPTGLTWKRPSGSQKTTRWAPNTSCKEVEINPFMGVLVIYNPRYPFVRPFIEVLTPFISSTWRIIPGLVSN